MNKQEFQQKLKDMESVKDFTYTSAYDAHGKGFQEAKELALSYSESLDEQEKPVLTKTEAEWLEGLKELSWLNKYDALYYITRQGLGHGFSYTANGHKVVLETPNKVDDMVDLKARLVNAMLFEYTVKKEKLYRARHKLTGEYLSQNYAKTGYYHGLDHFHILKLSKKDWEELGVLDDKMYEIEETEEVNNNDD